MNELPIKLCYSLNRRQRIIPHLKLWNALGPTLVLLSGLFAIAAFTQSAWFVPATIVTTWFGRGYVIGIADVLLNPKRTLDIVIEPLGIGFLCGNERWYVHMDGIYWIERLTDDVWTICHSNGTVINVPTDVIPDACVEHIRAAISGKWIYLQPFADEYKRKIEQAR